MAALEAGDFDSEAFVRWQEEERLRSVFMGLINLLIDDAMFSEEQRQYDEIENRHLLGQLSREEAILARQQVFRDNQRAAADFKHETARLLTKYSC